MALDWIGFGYAALVASGGIIGYAKAGSVPSLAAGLLFGGLAGLGAYQLSQDPKNIWLSLGDAVEREWAWSPNDLYSNSVTGSYLPNV